MFCIDALKRGEFDVCFPYLKDDTIWNTPGGHYLKGQVEIETFCLETAAYFKSVTTNFCQEKILEDTHCDCIAITGTAEFIRDGKRVSFVSSCDVYEFDADGKISLITSYCVVQKSDPEKF